LKDYNVIYLQGTKGKLVNMDIDCDGIQGSSADDGRCGSSGDTQSVTSFQDRIQDYGAGRKDLDANIHPYVVFGNVGTKKNWPTFDAQKHGIKPLSIIAVVCGEKMVGLPHRLAFADTDDDSSTEFGATRMAMMVKKPWSEKLLSHSQQHVSANP
jgi:hypothetical protein